MISYIKGNIENIFFDRVVLDNNGIGYNIQISEQTRSRLPVMGEFVKLYTYMNVKEDGISLYGFLSVEEIEMFNMLITVAGVGPKGALSTLSVMSPGQIALAVITDDIQALSKGQGIGRKTAQRIALELKDKINTENAVGMNVQAISEEVNIVQSGEKHDAIEALLGLGFGRSEVVKAVMDLKDDGMTSGDIIKKALKALSNGMPGK